MTGGLWPAIGAIAATIYTVAFVVSISLLVRELRVQSLSEAYDRLQTEDMRSARRAIYEIEDKQCSFDDWRVDSNSVAAAEKICQTYDYLRNWFGTVSYPASSYCQVGRGRSKDSGGMYGHLCKSIENDPARATCGKTFNGWR